MSKEAVVILLDVGSSMHKSFSSDKNQKKTRFQIAQKTIADMLHQKMLFHKRDEVGLVLYGTKDTDNQLNEESEDGGYENVTVLNHVDVVHFDIVNKITQLQRDSSAEEGDLLDGMIVALDLLFRRTDKKKYSKKMIVITDAESPIKQAADIEPILNMIQNMETSLQIIGIDFTVKNESVEEENLNDEQNIKRENEKMLAAIAEEANGIVTCVSRSIELLAQGKKKIVNQVTKFRGHLEIGMDLKIAVWVYTKTKKEALPTLSKESQASYDPQNAGKVKMDRVYSSQVNPDEEIPPENRVKAYRYGNQQIPFSAADEQSFKLNAEKGLKLLGFLPHSQINHGIFVGGTDILIGEPHKVNSIKAISALARALQKDKKVGLARFVSRKNSSPKVIVLIPGIENESDCLFIQQIAYVEDMRNYQFPSLYARNPPTSEQLQVAEDLIDGLSLDPQKHEVRKKNNCFNPTLQRFYLTLQKRSADPNALVSAVPKYIEKCLREDPVLYEKAGKQFIKFEESFQLKEAVEKNQKKKKNNFWSDINSSLSKDSKTGDGGQNAEEINNEDDNEFDLDDLLGGNEISGVGSMNPITDFETLISCKELPKYNLAVEGMPKQILVFFEQGESYHSKAIQCVLHFRKRAVELEYAAKFNQFLKEIKSKYGDGVPTIWNLFRLKKISLLSKLDDSTLDVSEEEAEKFLNDVKKDEENELQIEHVIQQEEEDEEEDMFAEME